jgi:outer membrane lipoprotein
MRKNTRLKRNLQKGLFLKKMMGIRLIEQMSGACSMPRKLVYLKISLKFPQGIWRLMEKKIYGAWLVTFFILVIAGCAPVISKEIRDQVAQDLSFKEVLQDPEAYRGKMVLWGGEIIKAENQKEGTLIEVLQKPTDREGRPRAVDQSDGRFLALYDGFLDVAIYARERKVTIAGEIKGKRVLPLGDIQYAYPLILVRQLHLWPAGRKERLYPHFYPGPYGPYPWWWYQPYPYRYW